MTRTLNSEEVRKDLGDVTVNLMLCGCKKSNIEQSLEKIKQFRKDINKIDNEITQLENEQEQEIRAKTKEIEEKYHSKIDLKYNETRNMRAEHVRLKEELYEKSLVSKDKVVEVVINALQNNTNKKWNYIEKCYEDEGWEEYHRYTEKFVAGFFVSECASFPLKYGFNSYKISEAAENNEVIILYMKLKGYPCAIKLYKDIFQSHPSKGLCINNKFYIEKYPFLKQPLMELINSNMK